LSSTGKIYSGCNVENAAYPLATCAERTALVKAVSEGEKSFQTIAITSYVYHKNLQMYYLFFYSDVEIGFTGPCGSCRQILAEFGLDLDVYLINPKNESKLYKLKELLPFAFTPRDLQKPRASHDIIE
jgi:cytidine deaminase